MNELPIGWGSHRISYRKIWLNLIYASDCDPENFDRATARHLFWRFWWFKDFEAHFTKLNNRTFDTITIHDDRTPQ